MFSKSEVQLIKKDFWVSFGKSFPRKWRLYDTKIKDFSFKFHVDKKYAMVSLDLEMKDTPLRALYFDKIWSLEDFLEEKIGLFYKESSYFLDNGKEISRFWVVLEGVSVFDKNSWSSIFLFFVEKMSGFESFYDEFEDFIKDIE